MRGVPIIAVIVASLVLPAGQAHCAPAPPSSISVFAPDGQNGDTLQVVFGRSPDDSTAPPPPPMSAPADAASAVVRYIVERKELPGGSWLRIPDVLAGGLPSYTFTNRGLKKGVAYSYRIAAHDGALSSYVQGTGTTQDRKAPGAPGLVAADRPNDQGRVIVLTITASSDDGRGADDVIRYEIQRREPGGTFAFLRNITATNAAQYVYHDVVEIKKRQYTYMVRAFDGVQFSDPATSSATGRDNVKPRPPRSFRAVDVVDDQGKALRLTWLASLDDGVGADDVRTYRLHRRVAGGAFALLRIIKATDLANYEFTDYSVLPDTTYFYRMVTWDGRNTSDPVYATAKAVDNRAPNPPTGLQVTDRPNDNGDALNLSWNRSPEDGARADDVKEYHVYRAPGPETPAALGLVTKIPATDAASYRYTDTGLTPGRTYTYVVRAFDGRHSSSGVTASGRPVDDLAPRRPPSVTVADVPNDNGSALLVSFEGSPDDGGGANDVIRYYVQRKVSGGAFAPLRTIAATDADAYQFTDTGLKSGTVYFYGVRAFDSTHYSTETVGGGATADNTVPAPPTDFVAVAAPDALGAADLGFTASADDTAAHPEVTAYEVFRRQAGTAWPSAPTRTVKATRAASYALRDTGLTVGLTYDYQVRARAATGVSAFTPTRKVTAADKRKPAPPQQLTAQDRPDDGGKAVIVAWKRSGDDGAGRNIVSAYTVYRKLTSVFESPATAVRSIYSTGAASYQIVDTSTELMNLRSYTYWAVAVSKTGVRSDPSNEAEAVPRNDTILAPPTNLTAADRPGGGNAIDLAWDRSSSEDGGVTPPPPPFSLGAPDETAAAEGDYEVFRRRSGAEWPLVPYLVVPASKAGDPLTAVDTQATNGVTFQYRVRYRVDTSISPFSNVAQAVARDGAASTASAGSGLSVAIVEAPTAVPVGAPIVVKVRVEGAGLSNVALQWRVNRGAWQETVARAGRDSYDAAFTLSPGSLAPGDRIGLVAAAADADGSVLSDEAGVEITP